jgi:ribosome biogenesis protein MAK21
MCQIVTSLFLAIMQIDMNPRLIGEDILQLAEDEVPPEDLFFHQYYTNRSGLGNRKTKKKAVADDEDEMDDNLLLDGVVPGDSEEDEEEDAEIDEMLGASVMSDQDEYDYDDLDR